MGEPIEKMMEGLQEPKMSKKAMLEENVKTSRKWADAIYRGQFAGKDALAIAGLAGFLDHQYAQSLAEYESAMVKNPEWGRPKDMPEANMAGRHS